MNQLTFKKASELYPNEDTNYFSDYQPILESFGEILIQVDDTAYQGDSRILVKKDGKFGLLIFGWGSCSGCDALQACGSFDEVDKLIEGLANDIKWFDNIDGVKKYVNEKDWELEYSWNADETKDFIAKIKTYQP